MSNKLIVTLYYTVWCILKVFGKPNTQQKLIYKIEPKEKAFLKNVGEN